MTEQNEGRGQIELQIGACEIVVLLVYSAGVVDVCVCVSVLGGVMRNASRRVVDRAAVIPLGCPGTLHHFASSGHELPAPQPRQVNNLINSELRKHANLTPSACQMAY